MIMKFYWLSVTDDNKKTYSQAVSAQLSCHTRTCMKFQFGGEHKPSRVRKSPSYDKTGMYIKNQICLMLLKPEILKISPIILVFILCYSIIYV